LTICQIALTICRIYGRICQKCLLLISGTNCQARLVLKDYRNSRTAATSGLRTHMQVAASTHNSKWETSMDPNGQARPFDLAEPQASNRLVQLIRKLRWINMDDEAERVSAQLTRCRYSPTETVIAGPWATD
jgi:hypothetical protein